MKAGKEHRVPLGDAALAVLAKQAAVRSNDYVFAGAYGADHVGTNLLSQTSLGNFVCSAHQSENVERNPCAVRSPRPRRRNVDGGDCSAEQLP